MKDTIIKVLKDNTVGCDDGYGGVVNHVDQEDYPEVADYIIIATGAVKIKDKLKEARDLLLMCTLIDKSGQCDAMVGEIDELLNIKS